MPFNRQYLYHIAAGIIALLGIVQHYDGNGGLLWYGLTFIFIEAACFRKWFDRFTDPIGLSTSAVLGFIFGLSLGAIVKSPFGLSELPLSEIVHPISSLAISLAILIVIADILRKQRVIIEGIILGFSIMGIHETSMGIIAVLLHQQQGPVAHQTVFDICIPLLGLIIFRKWKPFAAAFAVSLAYDIGVTLLGLAGTNQYTGEVASLSWVVTSIVFVLTLVLVKNKSSQAHGEEVAPVARSSIMPRSSFEETGSETSKGHQRSLMPS